MPETDIKLEPWQEILLKVADLLEEKGWIQGMLENSEGYCMIGALNKVTYGRSILRHKHNDAYSKTFHKLQVAIARADAGAGANVIIWRWNDKPGRTKEEVLTTIRQAAKCD